MVLSGIFFGRRGCLRAEIGELRGDEHHGAGGGSCTQWSPVHRCPLWSRLMPRLVPARLIAVI